ncbi:MAG TPA: hypothetical protein VHS27_04570 [Gaiellales bacterium]|jgi:hypothetical protein|nr:hypothetical protein [Gaiellales bacterium]
MPEGFSAAEYGDKIAEHAEHSGAGEQHERDWLQIVEAILLSVVAIIAAYSVYTSAQWSTHSSVSLAHASADRTKANRADLEALTTRNFDASTFNAWFTAYIGRNERGMRLAAKRFTPQFRVAFNAWWATHPETNSHAPPGPTYMPQYHPAGIAQSRTLDAAADAFFAAGEDAGATADKYVRVTVFLASVLFLVGISTHFPLRSARYGLVSIAGVLLLFSLIQLLQLPRPP